MRETPFYTRDSIGGQLYECTREHWIDNFKAANPDGVLDLGGAFISQQVLELINDLGLRHGNVTVRNIGIQQKP